MVASVLGEQVKRAVGEPGITALRRHLAPMQMAALLGSMARHGWTLDSLAMSDQQAAIHFANDQYPELFDRTIIRLFHQSKLEFLTGRLTAPFIAASSIIEVGDSDGLVLKAVGKTGSSINSDPRCVDLIRRNGVDAQLGLGERLDVPDKSFDVAMASETLEHRLNPAAFPGA